MAVLAKGDVLVVSRLDRLARSTRDLLNPLGTIADKGAGFKSLRDTWADTTTAHGRLMLTVLGGLAEFERELIRTRTGEGRERAKARGVILGRKPKLTGHQRREAIARLSTSTITGLVNTLTQEELIEDPNDVIAAHLLSLAQNFTVSTQRFYAFYLLSHGVIKTFLVAGLLRNKLWAYPVSLVVLGLFIVYQLYRFSYTHGVGLIVLTVFDVIVMGLIWHEYRLVRRHLTSR
jgi:uncharacterized membrane protein